MNEIKNQNKKIIISPDDKYEGKPVLDYLISSLKETENHTNNIHNNLSNIINNKHVEKIKKEEEDKLDEQFNKVFNKKNMNLFEFINDINKNHIKKYKTILKSLNLNLILDDKDDTKKEKFSYNPKNENNESNIYKEPEISFNEINKENKIEVSNIKNETKQKNENIIEKLQFEDNEIILNKENSVKDNLSEKKSNSKNNQIFKFEIIESKDIKVEEKKENDENNSNLFIDYTDNVNYFKNNNQWNKFKNKKFIFEDDDDPDIEENDIIINENDDSFTNINYGCSKSNNQNELSEFNSLNNNNFDKNIFYEEKNALIKESGEKDLELINSYNKKDGHNKTNININKCENIINKNKLLKNEKTNGKVNKSRINIKNVEKRLFKKNHTTNNISLSFIGNTDKNNACTCNTF